ncbi:MAG: type II secretion system protein [bacterium]
MNKNRNHGISLPELLGAIVIFGLVSALIGSMLAVFSAASKRLMVAEQANAKALSLILSIENAASDAQPTAYSACVGETDCIRLENHYEYVYNEITDAIDLELHEPELTTEISLSADAIMINGVALDTGDFTIDAASTLTATNIDGEVTVTIHFILRTADGDTYGFTTSFNFTESAVPAA